MGEAIDGPDEMSIYAPRIITLKIPVDKIGEVIGPKGKVINQIQDDTGADITIEDDGTIYVGADQADKAGRHAMINAIANPTNPERAATVPRHGCQDHRLRRLRRAAAGQGRPVAHLQAAPTRRGQRVENVEDVLSVGQKIQVEINEIDDRGKLSLVPVVEETVTA